MFHIEQKFCQSSHRGFSLLITILVMSMMSMTISMLWSTTQDDIKIAENKYQLIQAKFAAQSGISHFESLNLLRVPSGIIIKETFLANKVSYFVKSINLGKGRAMIISKGLYKKSGRTIFEYPIKAIVEWR